MSNLPRSSRAAFQVLAVLTSLAAASCVYDSDRRCGPAMIYVAAANACVCEDHAMQVPGGCQRCGDDEVVVGSACGCAAGMTKNAAHVCVAVAGLGDPCDADAPCTDAIYSFCAAPAGSAVGTCTKTCTSDTDCEAAYTCTTWEDHPYCKEFHGIGTSCSAPTDCTGDANFCDSFVSHTCIIAGCSLADSDCSRGTMCCDYSGYGLGTLCTPSCQ
jgi:hypothetical protein